MHTMPTIEWIYMNRSRETEENRGNRRITVSLGADVSEGYILRYETKSSVAETNVADEGLSACAQTVEQRMTATHHAEHFEFTTMTMGLETPQQIGERLAAQVIATLEARDEQPDRIACDLYPKFPTTYAAEVLAEHYQVPMLRMQKCHRAILDAMDASMQSDAARTPSLCEEGQENGEAEELDTASHRSKQLKTHSTAEAADVHHASAAVLGLCLDDLSYGSDGTLWGGEILEISGEGFTRLASIHPYQLIGTNMELHSSTPWQTAVSMLYDLARMAHNEDEAIRDFVAKQEASEKVHLLDLCSLNDARAQYIAQDRNKNTTRSTAASGLFDAAAAILGFQRISTPTGRTAMEALTEAAEAFEHNGKTKSQIDALYAKLEQLIAAAEEMDDPTLETGDLWEDTDDGAFSETSADDSPDILHSEQLIRLLADERIRYLTSLGKRNYDHPLNRKHPDAGSADDNSRLLAWFLLDALATICVQYCAGKHVVLSGHFLKATRLRERFEEKLKLARGPVVW